MLANCILRDTGNRKLHEAREPYLSSPHFFRQATRLGVCEKTLLRDCWRSRKVRQQVHGNSFQRGLARTIG
ncbi:hypothetical protein M404DRAFT_522478 [Pisolithus tinctorius Marx 270]|uniref:Uncharacterized protein n=1 Tax=Pisolithus tinctorius Marx 270 TaxID=870435 RepID=A0A0C3J8J4_PISTI|nr:hypothetical protein M404DRAFT_522478 [Pisolithus tinctorius Marx 270]